MTDSKHTPLIIGETQTVNIKNKNSGEDMTMDFISIEMPGFVAGGGVALVRKKEDATIIVRACNSHEALVFAAKFALEHYEGKVMGGDVVPSLRSALKLAGEL